MTAESFRAGVEDNGIVRKIIGDEQAVALRARQYRESSRIRERRSGRSFANSKRNFFPIRNGLRRNLDEALGTYLSVRKFVDRDAVAGALRLLAGGVGDRSH